MLHRKDSKQEILQLVLLDLFPFCRLEFGTNQSRLLFFEIVIDHSMLTKQIDSTPGNDIAGSTMEESWCELNVIFSCTQPFLFLYCP